MEQAREAKDMTTFRHAWHTRCLKTDRALWDILCCHLQPYVERNVVKENVQSKGKKKDKMRSVQGLVR